MNFRLSAIFSFGFLMIPGIGIPMNAPAQPIQEDIWADETPTAESLELSRDHIDQLLIKLDTESPALAEQLRKWRKEDPFRFVLEIRRIAFARDPKSARAASRQTKSNPAQPAIPADPVQQGSWRQTQEKRIDELLDWFKDAYPDKAKPLLELRNKDNEEFYNRISIIRRRYEPLMRAEKRDPNLAKVIKQDIELQDQCGELLGKIAVSQDKDRRTLTEQLKRIVADQFDVIVQKRRIQYAEIETKIQQMQKEIDEQKKQLEQLVGKKDQATQERVQELLSSIEQPSKP